MAEARSPVARGLQELNARVAKAIPIVQALDIDNDFKYAAVAQLQAAQARLTRAITNVEQGIAARRGPLPEPASEPPDSGLAREG